MAESSELSRIQAALRRAMQKRDIGARTLSERAGLGETAVRDLLLPKAKDVKVSTLNKLAGVLNCTLEDLIGADAVPLTGRIGAGGTIIFEDLGTDQMVVRPPGFFGPLEALEVVGDSMFPRYSSGDVVYICRSHDGVLPIYIGEFCAVRLVTGETYLKLLAKGSRPGRFTLRSLNAEDIEDVEVDWATPIVFVLPRYAR
jgi:repressor LexA